MNRNDVVANESNFVRHELVPINAYVLKTKQKTFERFHANNEQSMHSKMLNTSHTHSTECCPNRQQHTNENRAKYSYTVHSFGQPKDMGPYYETHAEHMSVC